MFNFEMFVLFVFALFVLVRYLFVFVKYICIMLGVDRAYDFRYSGNTHRKSIGIFAINPGKSGDV